MTGVRRLVGISIGLIASFYGMPLQAIIFLGVLFLFTLFVILPSIFHWNKTIQRHLIFLPWVKWPKLVDFDRPQDEGLEGTKNFYLDVEDKVKIGVWHILPRSLIDQGKDKDMDWYQQSLGTGDYKIVIYMHGNTGSRARDHRVDMYQVLRQLNYHVICFDYRGYADSSPVMPTKKGVIRDGKTVINYVRRHSGDTPIIVWGHSLGTAVSSAVVADLSDEGNPPNALILESPFNNIKDEIRVHPMTWIWRRMPMFDWVFTGTLNRGDVAFQSDECITHIHIPILFFHAKDDLVVPYQLGRKLYDAACSSRIQGRSKPVNFITFDEEQAMGHIFIHSAPIVPDIVKKFIQKAIDDSWTEEDFQ